MDVSKDTILHAHRQAGEILPDSQAESQVGTGACPPFHVPHSMSPIPLQYLKNAVAEGGKGEVGWNALTGKGVTECRALEIGSAEAPEPDPPLLRTKA